METKWTPGPWAAYEMQNLFQVHPAGVKPGYAERIADVVYWTRGHTGPKGNPLSHTARANAHLIAAAPDLYAALKMAQLWLDVDGRFDMQAINAALAKARGEA